MRALAALCAALAAGADAANGSPAAFPCVWTAPPTDTPDPGWPGGPILGNGNIGVSVGGSLGSITLYITVHGFWSAHNGTASPMPPALLAVGDGAPRVGFPGCPADDCTITVGLLLGGMTISSPSLGGVGATWGAVLDISGANLTVTLTDGAAAALELTGYVSATTQLVVLSLRNVGGAALPDVNVSSWANGNTQKVETQAQCADPATGAPAACSSAGAVQGHWIYKAASPPGSPFPITGVLVSRPLAVDGGVSLASAAPYTALEPHKDWSSGATVDTVTRGVTSLLSLPAGAGVALAVTAAASRDPGVYPQDPSDVAVGRLSNASAAALPALAADHAGWWVSFWAASGIALDAAEALTEGYWWSSLYALGSGTRAGQTVMDLWSPWRTSDYSSWRSNPTMDYNQQALYSGLYTSNHVDAATPYYDFVNQALETGGPQAEAAALGCPGGIHFSVDLAPFGLKLGVFGLPQDWGIRTNAAYAAVNYAYHFYSTRLDAAWVEAYAWPFLTGVAAYWKCALVKVPGPGGVGYSYADVNDCNGDEGCSLPAEQRTSPMWGAVYIRRLMATLVDMAAATGRAADPAWADILAHLAPLPVATYKGTAVLGWYGNASTYTNMGGQSNNLHALWPGELLSMGEPDAALLAAAQASFNFTPWTQSNSFNWVYSGAARAGLAPESFLPRWRGQLASLIRTNRLVAWAGACSDTLGAVQLVHDLLLQTDPPHYAAAAGLPAPLLRLFPAWPANESAAFTTLRVRGALLVSAAFVGRSQWAGGVAGRVGGAANVTIVSEAARPVALLSPWPAALPAEVAVCSGADHPDSASAAAVAAPRPAAAGAAACPPGTLPVAVAWATAPGPYGGPVVTFNTTAGTTYQVIGPSQA